MNLPNHRSKAPEAPPSDLSFEALMEAKLRAIAEGADALSEAPEEERVHAVRLEIQMA